MQTNNVIRRENGFKQYCKSLPKSYKNAPRICDIDIIDYSQKNLLFSNIDLKIPHPRMQNRSFVLFPLFEIDKKWKHPKNNKKITQLLNNLPTTSLRSIKIL